MNFYDKYTVIGSKIHVSYIPFGTVDRLTAWVGIIRTNNSTAVVTFAEDTLFETKNSGAKMIVGAKLGPNKYPTSISNSFSASKYFHKRFMLGNPDFEGTKDANPTEQCFWTVWVRNLLAEDPDVVHLQVTIDYIAVLTELKQTLVPS